MQKVVGSSPIIRFTKAPLDGCFCCLRRNRHRLVDVLCPFKGSVVGPQVRSREALAALRRLRIDPQGASSWPIWLDV